MGAKGFESNTYFEMALRDIQLIPNLEGSAHINLALAAQFIPRYFGRTDSTVVEPASTSVGAAADNENAYLYEARTTAIDKVGFAPPRAAYGRLACVHNVRLFSRQVRAFGLFVRFACRDHRKHAAEAELSQSLGRCQAIIAYAQLIAEHSFLLKVRPELLSTMFHLLVEDLSAAALAIASLSSLDKISRVLILRLVTSPRTNQADWDVASSNMEGS
jgi:acyl-CoA dehydrogenase